MHHSTDRIIHTKAFVTPPWENALTVEHWPEQEVAQWVHREGSIQRPIVPQANALTTELHTFPTCRSLPNVNKYWVFGVGGFNYPIGIQNNYQWNRSCYLNLWICFKMGVEEYVGTSKSRRGRKEGNVLFNDALNTFYLRLYGVRHMVKDNSDSERRNPLPPHGLLFSINSKGSFICTILQTE